MADIEPAGLPAVRLDRLRKLRTRETLTDEDMVRVQRENLLDPAAPNPSVETLLHAFLPHKFVDHTHSTAVLSLVDQPDGEAICAEVYDGRAGIVPYIMPGFALAQAAAEVFDKSPSVEGLILHKHGIFTFGDERARGLRAHDRAGHAAPRSGSASNRKAVFVTAQLPQAIAPLAAVAPVLRGACQPQGRRRSRAPGGGSFSISARRRQCSISSTARSVARYSQAGVVTPDHTIRTKNWPLLVPAPADGKLDDFSARRARSGREHSSTTTRPISRATMRASAASRSRSIRCRASRWCRGSACSASGRSKKDARVAADLAESAVETITDAEAIGRFESISEADMFDMEYWSLEQAKLGAAKELPLAGQIAAITGAAGAIGFATAKAFAAAGAEVALLDIDEAGAQAKAKAIGGAALAVTLRRDRRRRRFARPSTRSPKPSAASTSWCRTPARPGRAASARSTKRRCARASS